MSNKVIGTCSECGGRVCVPEIWNGINPPIPTCEGCKRIPVSEKPIIQMKRPGQKMKWMPFQ